MGDRRGSYRDGTRNSQHETPGIAQGSVDRLKDAIKLDLIRLA